jgi:plastocyanin
MKTNLIITAAIATLSTASIALAAKHVVTQSNFTFSPSSITVAVGDTVQFVRTGGNHTVTSGTACAASGLFSSRLSAATPSITAYLTAPAA